MGGQRRRRRQATEGRVLGKAHWERAPPYPSSVGPVLWVMKSPGREQAGPRGGRWVLEHFSRGLWLPHGAVTLSWKQNWGTWRRGECTWRTVSTLICEVQESRRRDSTAVRGRLGLDESLMDELRLNEKIPIRTEVLIFLCLLFLNYVSDF